MRDNQQSYLDKIEENNQQSVDSDEKITVSKAELESLLAEREKALEEKLRSELTAKTQNMASINDLDALVAKHKGNPNADTVSNQLAIKEVEVIRDGEPVRLTICEIVCANRSPVKQLLTLDFVAKHPEFAEQLAKHYKAQAEIKGKCDLDYDLTVRTALISKGILTKKILKDMSRSFLGQLVGNVYGNNSSIYRKIIEIKNSLEKK